MVTRAVLAGIGLAFACAAGCSLLTSYEGFGPAAEATPACGKRWPARPAIADSGERELVGAVSRLTLFDPPDGGRLGYDLDGLCTCPDPRQACRPRSAEPPCDEIGTGVDNAAGEILGNIFSANGPDPLNEDLALGRHGVVVRIRGYNGRLNDPKVQVSLFNVIGLRDAERAAFDGRDAFVVDALESTDFGTHFIDTSAYVAGGVLVAALDFDLRLNAQVADASTPVLAPIRAARLIGTVRIIGESGLELDDAQIVGRVRQEDLFRQIGRLGLCPGTELYPRVRTQACGLLDLPADPGRDRGDAPCDAISFAIGIRVTAATIGGQGQAHDGDGVCGAAPVEPCP